MGTHKKPKAPSRKWCDSAPARAAAVEVEGERGRFDHDDEPAWRARALGSLFRDEDTDRAAASINGLLKDRAEASKSKLFSARQTRWRLADRA